MYQAPGRSRPYYRCASRSIGGRSCGNGSIQADVLEQLTAELFLARVGHLDVMRKVYIAGEDHTDEINRIEEALARLVQQLEKLPDGGPAEAAILTRMREHETRLHELQAKPRHVDQWHQVPTGETFQQLWDRLDQPARGRLLRDSGVRIEWTSERTEIRLGQLEELATQAQASAAQIIAAVAA